jgi:acyl carrier protein
MGMDILDLVFRLERTFCVKIGREEWLQLIDKDTPPDVNVGELFELVRGRAVSAGPLDDELDAEILWPMFQRAISDALGIEPEEITKDKEVIRDLGAC